MRSLVSRAWPLKVKVILVLAVAGLVVLALVSSSKLVEPKQAQAIASQGAFGYYQPPHNWVKPCRMVPLSWPWSLFRLQMRLCQM